MYKISLWSWEKNVFCSRLGRLHSASTQRCFNFQGNIIWTLWTLDGHWNNVVCQLGSFPSLLGSNWGLFGVSRMQFSWKNVWKITFWTACWNSSLSSKSFKRISTLAPVPITTTAACTDLETPPKWSTTWSIKVNCRVKSSPIEAEPSIRKTRSTGAAQVALSVCPEVKEIKIFRH